MPYYALYNPDDDRDPTPVAGWYDTTAIHYPTMPQARFLLQVTDEQWEAHTVGRWGVSSGQLVRYDPPPVDPTPAQLAAMALRAPVVAISDDHPEIDGSYIMDMDLITSIATGISAGLGLPSGEETFDFADVGGLPHKWSAPLFMSFAREVNRYRYTLRCIAGGADAAMPGDKLYIK